ncbi:MAG: hypothetical protein STSR0008_02040 [Ignavibacterium sp.]
MKFKILILSSCIFLFIGCSQSVVLYRQNNLPSSLPEKRNDFNLSAQYGTNGFNFNSSYSLIKHFEFGLSGTYLRSKTSKEESASNHKNYNFYKYGEAWVGFYNSFNENIFFEFLNGFGAGKSITHVYTTGIDFKESVYENKGNGLFRKYFAQFNLGTKNQGIEYGFCIRTSYIDFYKLEIFSEGNTYDPNNLKNESTYLEQSVFTRFGGKVLKFQIQSGFAYTLKEIDYDFKSFIITFGIFLSL